MLTQKHTLLLLIAYFFTFLAFSGTVYAQSDQEVKGEQAVEGAATLGVARLVRTKDKNVKDGSILSASEQGGVLSTTPYDSQVLGIVTHSAAIVINTQEESPNVAPVISVGSVYVLVSSKEGPIKKGDQITTSTIPGVGVKATKSGYILGTAAEEYTDPDPKKSGLIVIDVSLHYFNAKPSMAGSLSDIFKIALFSTKDGPSAIFKYVIAAGVLLASIALGFLSFGRTAAKGIEALGRNPAASRIIHMGIIFNVFIVVVIVLSGMTVSFLILRL